MRLMSIWVVLGFTGLAVSGCPNTTPPKATQQVVPGGSTTVDGGAARDASVGGGGVGKDAGGSSARDASVAPNSGGCVHWGCSNQNCGDPSEVTDLATTCEYSPDYGCYQKAECARQSDGKCTFTPSQALTDCLGAAHDAGAVGTGLTWQETCGAPLCQATAMDDPAVANCTGETSGAPCTTPDVLCDLVNGCSTKLKCTDQDPTNGGLCPRSRALYKRDIAYLSPSERERIYRDLLAIPLASYEYKSDPTATPQLGFILEDVEPSPATSGDHVNLYGYLSMAVNAVQLQAKEIEALKQEVAALRAQSKRAMPSRPTRATRPAH